MGSDSSGTAILICLSFLSRQMRMQTPKTAQMEALWKGPEGTQAPGGLEAKANVHASARCTAPKW